VHTVRDTATHLRRCVFHAVRLSQRSGEATIFVNTCNICCFPSH